MSLILKQYFQNTEKERERSKSKESKASFLQRSSLITQVPNTVDYNNT